MTSNEVEVELPPVVNPLQSVEEEAPSPVVAEPDEKRRSEEASMMRLWCFVLFREAKVVLYDLSDLAENMYAMAFFSTDFTSWNVFFAFLALGGARTSLRACFVCLPLISLLLSICTEAAQAVLYCHFCGYSSSSIAFYSSICAFQCLLTLLEGALVEEATFDASPQCVEFLSLLAGAFMSAWYAFATGPFATKKFQTLNTANLWTIQ